MLGNIMVAKVGKIQKEGEGNDILLNKIIPVSNLHRENCIYGNFQIVNIEKYYDSEDLRRIKR